MKICVAPDLCCGAQRCIEVAPEVYTIKDGFNALVESSSPFEVPEHLEKIALRGARACPESAITIID